MPSFVYCASLDTACDQRFEIKHEYVPGYFMVHYVAGMRAIPTKINVSNISLRIALIGI